MPVTVIGQQHRIIELLGHVLGPLIGRGRVTGWADDHEGLGALGRDRGGLAQRLNRLLRAGSAAVTHGGTEGGDLLGQTLGLLLLPLLVDDARMVDRKSTRLNSSHVATSYAVFCLRKKTR